MKNLEKTKVVILIMAFLFGVMGLMAQDVTTVKAMSYDISNNLDLEAVASIFGDANDLEDFERRLNDPDLQISNLDLNLDGYVDYLRVVEVTEAYTHLIAIQAVLGDDLFQDVATIEVEKDRHGKTYVQVVGDVYMYGPNYIIEPVYVRIPVFFSFFWRPYYRPYCSPYYWGYYPGYFSYWHPYHTHIYKRHVHFHVNVHHVYHHVSYRRSYVAEQLHNTHRRNDFGRKYPGRSYVMRNRSAQNNTSQIAAASTKKDLTALERGRHEKSISGATNGQLKSIRKTDISKKAEMSRSNTKTVVTKNSKAPSKVNGSNKSINKGKTDSKRMIQNRAESKGTKSRFSNKDFSPKSGKSLYTKKSSERKDVAPKFRNNPSAKPKVNSTKQGSYNHKSNSSKSYQSNGRDVTSSRRSHASASQSTKKQTATKDDSNRLNKSSRSKTKGI